MAAPDDDDVDAVELVEELCSRVSSRNNCPSWPLTRGCTSGAAGSAVQALPRPMRPAPRPNTG